VSLEDFFLSGGKRGIQPAHAPRLEAILDFWRIVFRFEDGDAYDVDYVDYH